MIISRVIRIVSLVAACIVSTVSAQAKDSNVRSYEMDAGDFTELRVMGDVNVVYTAGEDSVGYVKYECTPAEASMISVGRAKNGRLEVHFVNENDVEVVTPICVRVRSRFLTYAENDGDSTLTVQSLTPCPALKARIEGNGNLELRDISVNDLSCHIVAGNGVMTVSGTAPKAYFSVTGSGSVQALNLDAGDVKCLSAGAAKFYVAPTKLLTANGTGGNVYYVGTPKIKKSFAVGVKVKPLSESK